jgi:hypothetical protein
MDLILWDLYELSAITSPLTGVKMRGRIRKFAIESNINLLVENTEDVSGQVRFAIRHGESVELIYKFLKSIAQDIHVELVKEKVVNPVLSTLGINNSSRYTI